MSIYIRVRWIHTLRDEPIDLLSELDDDRMETRKIYRFADGSVGFADANHSCGGAWLSYVPVPPLSEINSDPQFVGRAISKEEFEREWRSAATGRIHRAE